MKPHLIFLDIDGVLTSRVSMQYPGIGGCYRGVYLDGVHFYNQFDPDCVERLNRLVKETNADIVISSTWRKNFELVQIRQYFKHQGCQADIVGKTPNDWYLKDGETDYYGRKWSCRGQQIEQWRNSLNDKRPFVIFDDDADMGPYMDRLVKTDHELGLQDAEVEKAIALLNG